MPLLLAALLASAPSFDPLAFFAGRTEGVGRLKVALSRSVPVAVQGEGTLQPDGSLLLEQRISEGTKPPRTRQWRIRRTAEGGYTGTLSDALGPVTGEVEGNRLHLAFRGKGVRIEQWLTLAPDGQSAQNRLVARKMGVVVAELDETIRRTGP